MVKGFVIAARNIHPFHYYTFLNFPYPDSSLHVFDISYSPNRSQCVAKMHFLLYSNHISSDDRFYREALGAVVSNKVENSMADIKRLDKKGNIKTNGSTIRPDQEGAVKYNPAAGSEQWGFPAISGDVWIASAVNADEPSPPRPARVLMMDDEEIIRNLSREIFSALGHWKSIRTLWPQECPSTLLSWM
jgi:hypothetical protein